VAVRGLPMRASRRRRLDMMVRVRDGESELASERVPQALRYARRFTTRRGFVALMAVHVLSVAVPLTVLILVGAPPSVTIPFVLACALFEVRGAVRDVGARKGAFAAEQKDQALLREHPPPARDGLSGLE
jgi:hypothetical protein